MTEPVRRFQPTPEQQQTLVAAFSQEIENGELQALENVLAQDVVLSSDGGDKVTAACRPIYVGEDGWVIPTGRTARPGRAAEGPLSSPGPGGLGSTAYPSIASSGIDERT